MATSIEGSRKRVKTEVIDLTGPCAGPLAAATRNQDNDDDDDQVLIVDPPTVSPIKDDPKSTSSTTEVQVVGTVNALHLPHMRPHCTANPFINSVAPSQTSGNLKACSLCYCYVCDVPVKDCPCWESSHCNATDKGSTAAHWRAERLKKQQTKPILEARLQEGKLLENIVNNIKKQTDEINLEIDKEGIGCQSMSSDHVALICFHLKAAAFDQFQCEMPSSLWINLKVVSLALREVKKKSDSLHIKATSSALIFTIEARDGTLSEPYLVPVSQLGDDHLEIPSRDCKCNCMIPSATFRQIVDFLGMVNRACTIHPAAMGKDTVTFSAVGESHPGWVGKCRFHLKSGFHTVIDAQQEFEVRFSSRHLNLVKGCAILSPKVYLSMSPDVPLALEYPIGEEANGVSSLGYVKFYLAPWFMDE